MASFSSTFFVGIILCCFLINTAFSFIAQMPNRESRALTPSVNSYCMFFPERCRMMRFAELNRRSEFE